MIMTNKLLPVALIAALVGGSVGALVMHRSQPAAAETDNRAHTQRRLRLRPPAARRRNGSGEFNTAGEQTAYKTGFADGFAAAAQTENRSR